MKKNILKIATYISGVIVILLGLIYFLKDVIFHILWKMPSESTSSIGVIGGADGPTAIFLATRTGGISLELLILIFGAITTILFLLKRTLKNNG